HLGGTPLPFLWPGPPEARPARLPSPPGAAANAGARSRGRSRLLHCRIACSSRAMLSSHSATRSYAGRGGAVLRRREVTSRRAPACPDGCLLGCVGGYGAHSRACGRDL
ncbi:hypothetical protein P7K49_022889, partial [Saguinus oedipus]